MSVRPWANCISPAFKRDLRLGERTPHDLELFQEKCVPILDGNIKGAELKRTETGTGADRDSSTAQMIDPGDLLRELEWMVQRKNRHPVTDSDAGGPLGDSGCVNRGNANRTETREVVLRNPDAVEAIAFREINLPKRLLDDFAVGRGASAGEQLEYTDLQGCEAELSQTSGLSTIQTPIWLLFAILERARTENEAALSFERDRWR